MPETETLSETKTVSESYCRPLILGIETSCDDTACAVIDGQGRILSSVVSSQLKAHSPYGGVVPEIASREHLLNWPTVSRDAFAAAGISIDQVDAIAATRGPGLVGSLLVGLSLGRAIAFARQLPFHGVHHLEGHLYSPFLSVQEGEAAETAPDRFLGLVVSGGHTSLLHVHQGQVTSLVETRDDAIGEVFDKVGKRLGLGYPQGPKVDQLAERGTPGKWRFSVPRIKTRHGKETEQVFFSYSGLKSQVLREIEALEKNQQIPDQRPYEASDDWPLIVCDLLADFRQTAIAQLLDRLELQLQKEPFTTLAISGGVAANRLLRRAFTQWAENKDLCLRLAPLQLSGDNAAMIAFAGLLRQKAGIHDDPREAVVASRIPFTRATAVQEV